MITKLIYNWRQEGNMQGGIGEDYEYAELGKNGVKKITEHAAQGEGDRWYYEIFFENGSTHTIFNPNTVIKN